MKVNWMLWNRNLYRVGFIALLLPLYLSAQEDYDHNTGYVTDRCLAIKNDTLKKGTKLFILDHENKRHHATIKAKATTSVECTPIAEDRKVFNARNGMAFYTLDVNESIDVGMGFLPAFWVTRIKNFNFSHCTTSEGIMYNLWRKEPSSKQPFWSAYYYLAYDVEATCAF